jgi:uncharacterized Zn finger protein
MGTDKDQTMLNKGRSKKPKQVAFSHEFGNELGEVPGYIPVAERRKLAEQTAEKLQASGEELTPVILKGKGSKGLATSVWGRAWCRNLERYADYEHRLPSGRSYLRNGSVIDLRLSSGRIEAKVQGQELYDVSIKLDTCAPEHWDDLRRTCSQTGLTLIDLLQGRIAPQIMEIMTTPTTGLMPEPGAIRFSCTCLDWADLCKHAAAALYGVAIRLDEQPELLFLLRGVDHHELVASAVQSTAAAIDLGLDDLGDLANTDLGALFGIDLETDSANN